MSINCLNCHLSRTDSSNDLNTRFIDNVDTNTASSYVAKKALCHKTLPERSWSGNLMPPPHKNKAKTSVDCSSPQKKVRFAHHHRRHESMGTVPCHETDDNLEPEPRLVRSGGLRRDWSFEDLADQQRETKRKR